jgi:hypothetical protein
MPDHLLDHRAFMLRYGFGHRLMACIEDPLMGATVMLASVPLTDGLSRILFS